VNAQVLGTGYQVGCILTDPYIDTEYSFWGGPEGPGYPLGAPSRPPQRWGAGATPRGHPAAPAPHQICQINAHISSLEAHSMSSSDNTPRPAENDSASGPPSEAVRPPWVEPSPEAKAAAEPAKEAVKTALQEIKTPEQAEQVAAEVVAAASGTTEKELREHGAGAPDPAQAIQAAASTPGSEKAPATLVEAAKQVAGSSGETRDALEQALQEVTNPEQRGATEAETHEPLH